MAISRRDCRAKEREPVFSNELKDVAGAWKRQESIDCGRSITSGNESAVSYVISATYALSREATNPDEQSKKKKVTSSVRTVGKIPTVNFLIDVSEKQGFRNVSLIWFE